MEMEHQQQKINNCMILNHSIESSIQEGKERVTQQASLKSTLENCVKAETDATEELEV